MKLNIKQMNKARRLREKGYSYRHIARLLNTNVKQIYRWVKEYVGSYPQEGVDNKNTIC